MNRILPLLIITLFTVICTGMPASAEEPALPPGLGETSNSDTGSGSAPALPPGLGGAPSQSSEPALPAGLSGTTINKKPADSAESSGVSLPIDITGFVEVRAGGRTRTDHYEDDTAIAEARLQLENNHRLGIVSTTVVADLLYDDQADDRTDVDVNDGSGFFDLRQANVAFTPVSFMDVKLGRQILTWGTGDLLFINDLFPKDWVSFFIGRDTEYLKAPSDAAKLAFFSDVVNLDVVYTPQFDPDRYITGERISYYNAGLGRIAGQDAIVKTDLPDDAFTDDEIALRAYKNIQGYELALYYYHGFWKSPAGRNMVGKAIFPELEVPGASIRGIVFGGVANLEVGYMKSKDDCHGDNPMVRNSEWRALAGYEKDLKQVARDFTVGVQYYVERMKDYSDYKATLPAGMPRNDKLRQVWTLRLTKLLMQQNLTLSLFTYYSPTDKDVYLRPQASYKLSDHWKIEAGGNLFEGDEDYTFFGQFEGNSNVYAMTRYSF